MIAQQFQEKQYSLSPIQLKPSTFSFRVPEQKYEDVACTKNLEWISQGE